MPEGDTVYRTAAALRAALAGKQLAGCQFRVNKYANLDLTGLTVTRVWPHGKHLFIAAGEHAVHSHLLMDGAWHTYRAGEKWRKPAWQARVVLSTADWQAVGYSLGILEVLPAEAASSVTAHLGPDLLGPDWDVTEARNRLTATSTRVLGMALLDQRNLAGIGNVYRSELCFVRGLNPQTRVGDVHDLDMLLTVAHRMLWANRDRVQRCTTGNTRRGQNLWVYGREHQPCRRCGTLIERYLIDEGGLRADGRPGADERIVYVCPRCQGI